MRIIYTEITSNLTEILTEELENLRGNGKRIFYIVPSSLSFEKEREILEQRKLLKQLNQTEDMAIFDVMVTRFKQLPYYFQDRTNFSQKSELSQIGEAMLFRKILRNFPDEELLYFDKMRDSQSFVEKLIQLRGEMKTANLTAEDLTRGELRNSEKNQDLKKILTQFELELAEKFIVEDSFSQFIDEIIVGKYSEVISNSIFIIAGFTRFSAQERMLIEALNGSAELLLGTYASQKAVNQHANVFGVYSDSVQTIDSFQAAQLEFHQSEIVGKFYKLLTEIWEKENDFLAEKEFISIPSEPETVEIWEAENINFEVERLAEEIRRRVVLDNKLYKNFTVFVGNSEQYELPIKEIFRLYQIPFFYSQQEKMQNHPLIVLLESVLAIKKNNFQAIDIVNLLKTGLYSKSKESLQYLDNFEYYLKKFKIRGKTKFSRSFSATNYPENPSDHKQVYFEKAKEIDLIRSELIAKASPLMNFIDSKATTAETILEKFINFLQSGNIPENFQRLNSVTDDENIKDRNQQVWKLLQKTLSEFKEIFASEKMTTTEFLDILVSGVKNAMFRQVPATVDSVKIRDYELVEPRENEFIFVIGLTNSNFPRVKMNTTLLSEKDRTEINENNANEKKFIEALETNHLSKTNFTILSLLNSATEKLILSSPQIVENQQENESPALLQLLKAHQVPVKKIGGKSSSDRLAGIGTFESTFRSLLSEDFSNNAANNFWLKIKNYLLEQNPKFNKLLLAEKNDIKSDGLSMEVSTKLYTNLTASASSFEEFYTCEYKYFLDKTLRLQNLEEVTLESSTIGNYFHRIFELLFQNGSNSLIGSENFDEALKVAKETVDQEYQKVFDRDYLSRFTQTNLAEILDQSKVMVQKSLKVFEVRKGDTEKSFSDIQGINIRGKIDRIDRLDEFLGAVDYKSGAHDFKLTSVMNKTSLQLLTYLAALSKDANVWGALYLHLQNPTISLSKLQDIYEIDNELLKLMKYKGIVNQNVNENFDKISDFIELKKSAWNSAGNQFTDEDMQSLIHFAIRQYENGMERLKSREILVNPVYAENDDKHNVTGCRYCQFKSICRFEASRHSGRKINVYEDGSPVLSKQKFEWQKVLAEIKANEGEKING